MNVWYWLMGFNPWIFSISFNLSIKKYKIVTFLLLLIFAQKLPSMPVLIHPKLSLFNLFRKFQTLCRDRMM